MAGARGTASARLPHSNKTHPDLIPVAVTDIELEADLVDPVARNGEPEVAALHLRVRLDELHALRRASKRCSEIESFGDADGMEVGVPHVPGTC